MTDRVVHEDNGIVYGAGGERLDVHRPQVPDSAPVVLLWHGRGPRERDAMAPLARAAASRGMIVLVPDWSSEADDGGWQHLTESIAFTRDRAAEYGGDTDHVVLAGWSLGALAGAGLLLRPERAGGWVPTAFVGVAGRYVPDKPEMDLPSPVADVESGLRFPVPVELLHGTGDPTVPVEESRAFRDTLARNGHAVTLTETDSDHAGVVMTEYSPEHGRCLPAQDPSALSAGHVTVEALVRAAGLPPAP
ncbi:alpha/beta hydrolase family protein [Streptomyces sp. TR02-1]|uniref:alpha/beta hydrolase family protein n=1 Tax=Streptomyces sp. TR02-1 TaxID=3385977 RepID=UPI0039A2B76E